MRHNTGVAQGNAVKHLEEMDPWQEVCMQQDKNALKKSLVIEILTYYSFK